MSSALPISTRAAVEFTPPWRETEDPRPVLLLKVPSRLERIRFREAMLANGFTFVPLSQLVGLLVEMIEQAPPSEERTRRLSLLEKAADFAAVSAAPGADMLSAQLGPEEAAGFAAIEQLGLVHYPPYAQAVARREAFLQAMPQILFRMFCVGWSGYAAAFERGPEGVSDAAMDALGADADILAAAARLSAMLRPTEADAKNSAGPSPSPSEGRTSTARKPRRTAAKAG